MPNQHGAWAMLAGPLLVGVLAGGPRAVHVPLTLLWLLGYFAFFAAALWLKARRRKRYRLPVVVYSLACVPFAVLVLLWEPGLAVWGIAFAPLLVLGLVLAAVRKDRTLLSGLASTVAASLMTGVAYDAGDGGDWMRAWVLTATMAAYYVGTLLYVKTMIRQRGHRRYVVASMTFHALATLFLLPVSWGLGVLFAVLSLRAALAPGRGLSPKQVGVGELVLNAIVVAVAVATV